MDIFLLNIWRILFFITTVCFTRVITLEERLKLTQKLKINYSTYLDYKRL